MKRRLRAMVPSVIKVNIKLLYRTSLFFFKKPTIPEKRFVIYSLGRSGSTLLVSLLNSHDHIHCDGEILNNFVLFPMKHVETCASMSKAEVYGFKLLTYQLEDVQRFLHPRRFILELGENGYKIIYLTRANLLRQALSNIYARQVQFHSRVSDGRPKEKFMRVEVADVLNWIKGIESRCKFEREILEGVPHLSLVYEDDLQDNESHQRTIERVCDFIGTSPAIVSTSLQKVTPRALSDWVINFEELSEAIGNTPYAKFLSDTLDSDLSQQSPDKKQFYQNKD